MYAVYIDSIGTSPRGSWLICNCTAYQSAVKFQRKYFDLILCIYIPNLPRYLDGATINYLHIGIPTYLPYIKCTFPKVSCSVHVVNVQNLSHNYLICQTCPSSNFQYLSCSFASDKMESIVASATRYEIGFL